MKKTQSPTSTFLDLPVFVCACMCVFSRSEVVIIQSWGKKHFFKKAFSDAHVKLVSSVLKKTNIFSWCMYWLWQNFRSVLYSFHFARARVSGKKSTKQKPFKAVFQQLVHSLSMSPKSCCRCWVPKTLGQNREVKSNRKCTQTAGRGHSTRWEELIYITFLSSVCVNNMKKWGKT